MCGIAGYIGSRTIAPERIRTCLERMHRRGPDHADYRHEVTPAGEQVYLLSSRLSIIDLDPRSNQPFPVGRRWMVYNGELYNYLELREELRERGRQFRTASDTEVMLAGIAEFGAAWLDRCEGMWAFAAYDGETGSLLLSRDRFGEKPLYLYRDSSGLYFGSEVKFIFDLLGRQLPVNIEHLYRFLVNGYKALYKGKEEFFRGLEELAPASVLTRLNREESEQRYWEPRFAPEEGMSREEAVAGARERLIRAVKLRLRADVPLAFALSGGVDSNSLVSIAKNELGYDVHGFTITNLDSRYDEAEMVGHAVERLGIRHTAVPAARSGFIPKLEELVRQHDAPVYTINYFAHWLLMEAVASSGYRIAVSGTAADELFTGYYDHHLAYLAEVKEEPGLWRQSKAAWEEHIKPMVRNPFLRDPDLFVTRPLFRDHLYLDAHEFSSRLLAPWREAFREERYTEASLLRNRMLNEMFHENIPVILHEDDLNAMYFSVENRSPYLDRELFEFAYRIPTRHLIRDGFNKSLLRDAMRGIVPDLVLDNRRKIGFNASIYSFLDVSNPEVRSSLLAPSPIFEHVRREKIEKLIEKPDLPNSESKFLFSFLSAKLFLEAFSS